MRRNNLPLNVAGNQTLLPQANYLTDGKHLLDTHVLHVELMHLGGSSFHVDKASIKPLQFMEALYNLAGPGQFERVIEENRMGLLAMPRKTIGTMYIVCTAGKAMQCRPLAITQEVANSMKKRRRIPDWEERLQSTVVNGDDEVLRVDKAGRAFHVTSVESMPKEL